MRCFDARSIFRADEIANFKRKKPVAKSSCNQCQHMLFHDSLLLAMCSLRRNRYQIVWPAESCCSVQPTRMRGSRILPITRRESMNIIWSRLKRHMKAYGQSLQPRAIKTCLVRFCVNLNVRSFPSCQIQVVFAELDNNEDVTNEAIQSTKKEARQIRGYSSREAKTGYTSVVWLVSGGLKPSRGNGVAKYGAKSWLTELPISTPRQSMRQ